MAEIDTQITFDAATIVQTYGTNTDPNNPTQVDAMSYVYMVTRQGSAISGNGGGELNIGAITDDTLRWREASLSPDYSAILYAFAPADGGGLIQPPVPLESTITVPLPNPADPTQPGSQTIKDYFWNSTVLNPGNLTFHFNFMIVSRSGAVQGYYWFDPFITINS